MSYTKTTWQNDQAPAINATNLNHIETGIFNNDSKIAETLSTLGLATDTWNSSATYSENDIVIYSDKLYKNITGDYTITNPAEDTTNWMAISVLDYIAFSISSNSKNTLTTSTSNTYSCTYINQYFGGVGLFTSSGGETGNITLNDSVANYTKIEIVFTDNDGYLPPSQFFYNCNGKRILLFETHEQYIKYKEFNVSGTSLNIAEAGQISTTGNQQNVGNNYIKILKVIGYK